jgi:hypothetical protein
MGRDAVGFLSKARYDGEWHNYQCKQLAVSLGIGKFVLELGKILHHHCEGAFTMPTRYVFVAPNGGVGPVKKLIARPSTIGPHLVANWEKYCLNAISESSPSPLTNEIRQAITAYDFTKVELWKASELVEKPHMSGVMSQHIDMDPGAAPTVSDAEVPTEAEEHEHAYIAQLVAVFGERRGASFADLAEIASDQLFGPQMTTARRRYLEHRAFGLHFRDSLSEDHVRQVDKDVYDTVVDHYHQMAAGPKYDRLAKLMSEASAAVVSGPLGKHNRVTVSVRQGACHHNANTGKLPWS